MVGQHDIDFEPLHWPLFKVVRRLMQLGKGGSSPVLPLLSLQMIYAAALSSDHISFGDNSFWKRTG